MVTAAELRSGGLAALQARQRQLEQLKAEPTAEQYQAELARQQAEAEQQAIEQAKAQRDSRIEQYRTLISELKEELQTTTDMGARINIMNRIARYDATIGAIMEPGANIPVDVYTAPQQPTQGAYWYNPTTGDTMSSIYDLSSKGYVKTETPVEVSYQTITPTIAYRNIFTGETIEQTRKEAPIGYKPVYINPLTSQEIKATPKQQFELVSAYRPQQVKVEQPIKNIFFKDISWKETLSPAPKVYVDGKLVSGTKAPTFQDWIETKFQFGARKFEETPAIKKVTTKIPFLGNKTEFRITDIGKFALFSPLMEAGVYKKGKVKQILEKQKVIKKTLPEPSPQVIEAKKVELLGSPEKQKQFVEIIKKQISQLPKGEQTQAMIRAKNWFESFMSKEDTARVFAESFLKPNVKIITKPIRIIQVAEKPLVVVSKGGIKQASQVGWQTFRGIPWQTFRSVPVMKEAGLLSGFVSTATKQQQKQKPISLTIQKQPQIQLQIPRVIQKLKQPQIQKQAQAVIQIQKPAQMQIPQLAVAQLQVPKLKQPQIELQIPRQILRTPQKITTEIKIPTPIKIPRIIIKPPVSSSLKMKSIKNILASRKAYSVQIRRKGKFFEVGKGLPLGKALKLGAAKTTGTLAATFRLIPKGTTTLTDIKYTPSMDIFAKPKKPVGGISFVEKLGKRLKRGTGEIPEIKLAKKQKARRMKWW